MIADSFHTTGKIVSFTNPRNLGFGGAYTNEMVKEEKHFILWQVAYTFTEQDYLDAKN